MRKKRCVLCKTVAKITDHHYFWPKKKHPLRGFQVIKWLCASCHDDYHTFYHRNCTQGHHKRCKTQKCHYAPVCCYEEVG